ncbi:MAG: hypothetical protein RLZ28_712 [Actinomycetota bacterium]|jgi:hypothetical protein
MFEAKSELRNNFSTSLRALKVTTALTVSLLIIGSSVTAEAATAKPKLPATVKFLTTAFTPGEIQANLTSGFAIEALAQLSGANLTVKDLSPGIRSSLTRSNRVLGTSTKAGYLMRQSNYTVLPGLAGKYLFAGKVLKFGTTSLEAKVTALLRDQVGSNGSVSASAGNAQDVAWVVLGLQAAKEPALASKAAGALIRLQHVDGGFNYDPTLTVGGTDVTSIVIQALQAVTMPNKSTTTARNRAVAKAVAFLKASTIGGNHFQAYGDVDPNGTAYAIMALASAGEKTAPYVTWLKARLNRDGGVEAPWAAGVGDRYVTAQAYLPLIGKNYVSLLAGK